LSSKWGSLGIFLLLVVGGGISIGFATSPGEWYAGLIKPSFNPPNWIFGPVWTALYVMIAIAGWMLWINYRECAAMKIWWVALALNFLWSPSFFGMQNIGLALAVIIAMFLAIVAFIVTARRNDGRIALLFAPYAAWVGFASLLNASIFWLN
jgi:translocator protein